jgi:hypothetical protein
MFRYLNQKGQSSIEFVLSFIFMLSLFFLFVQLAINLTSGYFVHYATFMASRVFLTQDNANASISSSVGTANGGGGNSASAMAVSEFNRYRLDLFGIPSNSLRFNIPESGVLYEFVGAYVKYQKPITIIKAIGGNAKVDFLSESFLGKEPTRHVCLERSCKSVLQQDMECSSASMHLTLFDNGC